MKYSNLIKTAFISALICIVNVSCSDDDPINVDKDFVAGEKIIARAVINTVSNNPYTQYNQFNQNYTNFGYRNNPSQNTFVSFSDVEFVRVGRSQDITTANIETLFQNSEKLVVKDNIISSSNEQAINLAANNNPNLNGNNNFYPTNYQNQGMYPNSFDNWNMDPRFSDIQNQLELRRQQVLQEMELRRQEMNQRMNQQNQLHQMNDPRLVDINQRFNEDYRRLQNQNQNYYDMNNWNPNTTYNPYDYNNNYYNNDINNYNNYNNYNNNNSVSLVKDSLKYSESTTCSTSEGCFWFSKLDNFLDPILASNVESLWKETAVSFRARTCSSTSCTKLISYQNSFIPDSNNYYYAVYTIQE